jgi:hypothetical protein
MGNGVLSFAYLKSNFGTLSLMRMGQKKWTESRQRIKEVKMCP